jgi:hypothetical protein
MFFRVTRAGAYQYVQIARSERDGKTVRQQTLVSLGRLDVLQATGQWDALMRSGLRLSQHLAFVDAHEAGKTEAVVKRQLNAVIDLQGVESLANAVVAYEPVWAIGTGKTATPQQAQDVHAFIRGQIAGRNTSVADKVQILYGGSVKGSNASELLAMPDIDGGLIGGASLKADEFLTICQAG